MDPVVVPALNRFIENVYVYDLQIWDALEESFGEDRHALNQSPVFLSFAEMKTNGDKVRQRIVHTRVLAYSNLKDGRPWGLDIYRCLNAGCNAPAYNMIFHPHGKQYYGKQWLQTKIKYECLQCGIVHKAIQCPPWIHAGRSQNFGRVWYEWPLSAEQKRDIGIICWPWYFSFRCVYHAMCRWQLFDIDFLRVKVSCFMDSLGYISCKVGIPPHSIFCLRFISPSHASCSVQSRTWHIDRSYIREWCTP